MTINPNTRIANLLRHHAGALDAIISLSPRFNKLRNPVLRKLMAARTSIAMASKIGGCGIEDFYQALKPLGFEADSTMITLENKPGKKVIPAFMHELNAYKMVELDVRPVIDSGNDPLSMIVQKVKSLESGEILRIINHFEPTPLMRLLGNQGFESYAEIIHEELVNTYFYKNAVTISNASYNKEDQSAGWNEMLNRFKGALKTIDVRNLEMPLPMHTILDALIHLPEGQALFVYHKRIPVFLLPELEEQQLQYRIKEISDVEVHLLIYKD